ncbi:hypothetical protein Q3G72_021989 [Acer saccharum]|nr:hypothetical protein Q3G72_021989 [Acer saccharum]
MSQPYRSHGRAAQSYIDIFASLPQSLITLVDDPDEANVSYLHMEPHKAANIFKDIPRLHQTYKIGYCVWEADRLPKEHLSSIQFLDEVWTASLYNWQMYNKVHPRVRWIPHVTGGATRAAPSDIDAMKQMLDIKADDFVFLSISEDLPRKNIVGLTQAFHHVQQRRPNARLIVKTDGESAHLRVETRGRVTFCRGDFSNEQIAAMYSLCHTYVSAHCGEGWGLTLSDAMQHDRLCIATGYSGNMEFMSHGNSLLVDYSVDIIDSENVYYFFEKTMSWAYPRKESIEAQMLRAIELVRSGQATTLVTQAAQNIKCFDRRHIGLLVRQQLRDIAQHLDRTGGAKISKAR